MKKNRILLVLVAATATFLLVYSPHYRYPFPSHADEWHHITETIRLEAGGYSGKSIGLRLGFHIFLLPLSRIADLVLIYKFLPAIWAVLCAFIVFFTVYRKTGKNFFTAAMAMVFFASIKSNVNITGLWFFTPLTFSIPFIFLYAYFFTEGLEKENKKFILLSLLIMAFLLPIHAISVLFAFPFLIIHSLFNLRYIKKEWKFFSLFLIIPLGGMVFYKFMMRVPWPDLINNMIQALQFKRGWGKLEINNSPSELYSLIGYISVIPGIVFIFSNRNNFKKYLAYLLWPICILISIIVYRISGISYLIPYQRNLYYFAISLPLLSALGTDYFLKGIWKVSKKTAYVFIIIIVISTFWSYWRIPKQVDLYEVIDGNDYRALIFLSSLPQPSVVMAPAGISEALYPVSRHQPVATYAFYGNRQDSEKFFNTDDCKIKEQIIGKYGVRYILSKFKINCGWKLIYDKGDYIYEAK
ncbi:MAG: hypothetical protein ABSE81_03045 [Candidatus Omnitrophota bacterium]|jgi:hypothetical protein